MKEELSGARSADELTYLIRHSASAGLLEQDDATLLDRSLRFSGRTASDVMTPRIQMSSVPLAGTAAEVLTIAAVSGHSRLPVVDEGPDHIVGLVHVKQAFAVPMHERDTTTLASLMSEPARVPESLPAPALLEQLRGRGLQLAVVTDEYGGTAGLVTLEDLVEEIIGELEDEHDRYRSTFTRRGRSTTFDASWRPDELLARAGIEVPQDDDWDTVAGYLAARLERLPEVGDEVEITGGALRVDRTEGHRVSRVQFIPDELPVPSPAENPADKDPADKDPADKDPADKDPADKDPADKESGDRASGDDDQAPAVSGPRGTVSATTCPGCSGPWCCWPATPSSSAPSSR